MVDEAVDEPHRRADDKASGAGDDLDALEQQAEVVRRCLSRLDEQLHKILGPSADSLGPLDEVTASGTLISWAASIARGKVPEALEGLTLKEAQERVQDLYFYFARICLLPGQLLWSVDLSLQAARSLSGPQEAAEQDELRKRGREKLAALLELAVGARDGIAAQEFKLALYGLLAGLGTALQLLCDVNPEHLFLGVRTHSRLMRLGEKDYKRAAVELFRRIIKSQGRLPADELWNWAGSGYFQDVELDGMTYRFKKQGSQLVILRTDRAGQFQLLRRQNCVRSTLYNWRREALSSLD